MTEREADVVVIHATCVALGTKAALIRGKPGAGKSDLALRFLYLPERKLAYATGLIADDRTELFRDGPDLMARCPAPLTGIMEVRGLGVVAVPAVGPSHCVLVVDLVSSDLIDRLPSRATEIIHGTTVEKFALDPWSPSSPIKLALALQAKIDNENSVDYNLQVFEGRT